MKADDLDYFDFLASSIHDMKNSLNIQLNTLETVANQCAERQDMQTHDSLGLVIFQASRMNVNLVQLLSLYKLEKSIYPIDIKEQSVWEVIDEVLQLNKSIMHFKGISVTMDCDPDCLWYIERDLISGVLINALNNAYHYTSNKIHVTAKIEGDFLELRVEDNGTGYPPGMLKSGGTEAKQGVRFSSGSTGLGFYFSSQVAQLHKHGTKRGSLTIENGGSYGGGCFVVRLP